MQPRTFDRVFLGATIVLVVVGFIVFTSASLGLLARPNEASFAVIAFKQAFLGIGLGSLALLIMLHINFRVLQKYAFYIFVVSLGLTALVFVPGVGFSSGGAARWIHLGSLSWQPAEFLKLAYVLYLAAILASARTKVRESRYGILPFAIITALVSILMLLQPDTGTFIIISTAGLAMLFSAGIRFRDALIIMVAGILVLGMLAYSRLYVRDRIMTFLDPSRDPQGSSYQLQQSLIAIGSGGFSGRGLGQSVQKFKYLPEPIGDSVFAVAAEEFGFIGGVFLIGLFLFLGLRGLRIASQTPNVYGGLVCVGVVILILSQSFVNIASMMGVLPLTGVPMLFVSHGGTAMFFALAEIGIILNISRYRRINA